MHRRMLSYFFALAVATGAFLAHAELVGEDTARAAAEGFLSKSSVAKMILAERSVDSVEAHGNLWIVRLAPSGYIEIAGSTKCAPILSFSENDFAEPEADSPLAAKLTGDNMMVEAKEADENAADNSDWAKYTAPATRKRALLKAAPTDPSKVVGPFLGATWNQTAPYNDLSPYNYFCGCMATAAGQELRYWRWPYRCENFRSSAHGVRDAKNNYHTLNLHLNGLVPFDWDKVKAHYRDESNASTPWANDKQATYNAAYLTLWAQSLTGMGYKPGGSGGTQQLASNAEIFGYERGRVYTYWGDGYTNLWNAIKADLDWGSPIQINTAAHQMVIDGYAIENEGKENEVDYINLNLGYGGSTYWDNLKTAVTEGTYSGTLAAFQTGYRPQKIVQFEPVPKVITSGMTIAWHIAPCYTNKIDGFSIYIDKAGEAREYGAVASAGDATERYTYTVPQLDNGEYTFTVTPVMKENEGEGRANSVTTTIGTPKAAPEFLNVSSVACGIELLQQDIFIECAYGQVNDIKVTCSESTTSLTNYSSHTTIIPDNKISVTKEGNVFTVSVDATDMLERWNVDGEMILLTMVASNDDGTEAYKNLMLRFNSMRQVINGTFDAAEGDSNSAVWFCGDTTIDAKGMAVSFGASAFQGTGKVTLTDSDGGGSFTFASLDNFRGTLVFTGSCSVTLPEDMTKFEGTLSITSGTYTLSNDLSDSTKVIIADGVTVTLDNANVASTITGAGAVSITSGSSVLSGSVTSSVKLFGGDLTIPAVGGDYSLVAVGGGTLKIQLTKAQSILGYDWWLPLYTSGSVKFVLYDGTEVDATTTSATPGIKIAHSSEANVWTGTDYATFGETYSSKWSNGLPNEGDYVVFKSELNDWMETGTDEGTMMALNLTSPRSLGYVLVKGTDKLEIGTYSGATSALLSTDVLENEVETHITTTYFQPKTVIPHKTLSTSSGFILSCELDSTYAEYLKKHETGGSSLPDANYWRGTVVFCNRSVNSLELPNYGNAQSKVRFNGASGSIRGDGTFAGTMELVDYGETPALNINGGSSNYALIIGSVTSNGMFKTSTSGNGTSLTILLKDISGWTGSFDLADKTIAIGQAIPSSYTGTDGRLHICQAATVVDGATWKAAGGLYLGAGGVLTINGAVETKNVTTYGSGASITLEDGAVLQVAAASANDVAPTLNFKAGTYRVKEGSDAFRETATINFCAASGKRTVIDANGATLTLGPNVFSGSGDVYLTSSKEGGKIIVEGVPASYTGRIYCDISCGVSLGDLSKAANSNIDVSDIIISRSSSDIGNLTIGSGATLEVTVSKAHIMSGLEIDSVTLVDGGTLVLRDKSGKELEYTTSDGKYILEGDSSVTAECLLDYEFNGNAASTGSDNSATLQASSTITYYDGSALYTKCTPWINKEFAMPDDEWTAVIRGTLPAANSEKPTIVIMFGANGGNIFGLVAGTEENTVALADRSGIIGSAVAVDDATTKYHVYTIVKTASRVRLYVDGELKVDESKVISIPKKFQFGSVHGSNNSSYASCTGDESRIDYFKFYDFAVDENFDEMVYSGPKPVAVWEGDFSSSELTKFSGYTLVDGQQTHGENNSSITIDQDNQGLTVRSSNGLAGLTVIVRYSNLQKDSTNKRVLFTSTVNSNYTGARTGIRLGTDGALRGLVSTGDWGDSRNIESGSAPESGIMAFAYSKSGTYLYTGDTAASLVAQWGCAALKWDADSNNSTIYGASIGGYGLNTSVSGYEAAKGMTISAVAVFTNVLTIVEMNAYKWPSELEPEEPEITYEVSPEQGAVPVGTKMTVTCDDPTATIYYQKYGETEWSVYTEPVALSTGLNYYYVKVNDSKATLYTYMVAAPAVARIEGGDNYTSLQDAIDAASSDAENPSTITLLQSSEEEVTLSDKTIILDENGCTFGSLKGTGTLRMVGALPSASLKTLLQDPDNWTGVFYLSGYTAKLSNFSFNWWGNTNSTVRVNGINGYAGYVGAGGGTTYIAQIKELQVVEGGIEFNDAFGGHNVYIDAKITGDGKFAIKTKNSYTTASDGTRFIFTGDMDDYTGELDCSVDKDNGANCSTVVILGKDGDGNLDSLPTATAKGQIIVTTNANVTVNNGWKTVGGVVINGAVTLGSSASITGAISLGAADATLTVPSGATAAEPTTSVGNAYVKHVEDVYSVETYKTITFKNEDGSTLYTIANAKLGDTPVYVGDTPTKASTAQYDYTFDGVWDPAITTVTGDATYTAQFTPVLRSYEVTFDAGEHGSIAEGAKQMVAYGSTATPPEVTPAAGWSFTGWDGDTTAAITEVMTFTAQYAEKMTTTDYPVPYSWFIAHGIPEEWVSTVMKSKVSGSDYTWWEYYVLGLDPTNETSKFEVSIRMEGQTPIVEYSPTNDTIAIEYILQGNMGLSDEGWSDCPSFDAPGDTNRFFRVKVKW